MSHMCAHRVLMEWLLYHIGVGGIGILDPLLSRVLAVGYTCLCHFFINKPVAKCKPTTSFRDIFFAAHQRLNKPCSHVGGSVAPFVCVANVYRGHELVFVARRHRGTYPPPTR